MELLPIIPKLPIISMTIQEYLNSLNKRFKDGISREHSYRTDLENLIRSLVKDIQITNEPQNVTDCGNPDYVITRKGIPVGFIEAKDIGKDITNKNYKEQFDRYKKALDNLIITDYLRFQFFQNGELVHDTKLGEIEGDHIKSLPTNFEKFANLISNFCTFIGQTIHSAKKLAEMMAAKARLLQNILAAALNYDLNVEAQTSLTGQYQTFKEVLIHDLDAVAFADIYAQTLAYGMFAARLHDTTLEDFSRQEAAELIPKSNPFLRKLFIYIAGPDIDERIKTTVENLAEVYRAASIVDILKNFGKATQTHDPIIHFYETFLSVYDPNLRKKRGVWYTPEPVVDFMVRAVDDILKSEFDLEDGLADTSKTKINVKTTVKATSDKRSKVKEVEMEREVHRVQILDPATGTGTFLAQVIKYIYSQKFSAIQGVWNNYVERDLIPRLNGFELLMASYAMAHLKLDMLLFETGYKSKGEQRLNIFLTNSLEEAHPDTNTLLAQWLSDESNAANRVKNNTPVMIVIGNPPYNVSSNNASIDKNGERTWIGNLVLDYKKDLKEKKINLDDDYIKFIRYGQYFIDKNGNGILAYITNNSFIDGITHRQMRKHLLDSFDKIYILDLHGSAKKKEVNTDGTIDQNVFDIMQGVSINLFIKTNKKRKNDLAQIFHHDLKGKRIDKYSALISSSIKNISFNQLSPKAPYYFFVPKDFSNSNIYNQGFSLIDLCKIVNNGYQTDRDSLFIDIDRNALTQRMKTLFSLNYDNKFSSEYKVIDSSSYKIISAITKNVFSPDNIIKTLYRPFDIRYVYYDNKVISRPAQKVFKHFTEINLGLIISKQQSTFNFQHIFITNIITERCSISSQTKETGYVFPLYLYPEGSIESQRICNLNKSIINKIATKLNYDFIPDENIATDLPTKMPDTFTPLNVLDYIYAILYSPAYREKYKEFLKIDFPRVPYPKDVATFRLLIDLGSQLRKIHLMESSIFNTPYTTYPIAGNDIIDKPIYRGDKVFINETQYFAGVPKIAWEFYIGGYQPAQKWLKDRKGHELHYDDIIHYQKIIIALIETDKLMKEVDNIDFL